MNNKIWEFFFFRDILFFRQGEDQTAQAKTHFVQAITFWCVMIQVSSSELPILWSGSPWFHPLHPPWFLGVFWTDHVSAPLGGPDGSIPRQLSNYKIQADQQVREVHLGSTGPCFGSRWDLLAVQVAVTTCCDHLLWPLAVTTCCDHLLWPLAVFFFTEHCDIMSMFMNMHGLIRDMVNTIVLSWSWGFTTSIRPVRIENMLGTFCLPISPHLYRICTPLYMGLFIWVNYNDLTATSLESWLGKGKYPQIALIQVSEIL